MYLRSYDMVDEDHWIETPMFLKLAEQLSPEYEEIQSRETGFEPTAVRDKWFELNDTNYSSMN